MTSAQVVETSVTNNGSSLNYIHPDDHTIRTTDTPGFKPFIMLRLIIGLGLRLLEIIDLLVTDKSQCFAQPRPVMVNQCAVVHFSDVLRKI